MDNTTKEITSNVVTMESVMKKPVSLGVALAIYFVCGFFASLPCLCFDGQAKSQAKFSLFLLISIWLVIQAMRKKLYPKDVLIYGLIFGTFVIFVENM